MSARVHGEAVSGIELRPPRFTRSEARAGRKAVAVYHASLRRKAERRRAANRAARRERIARITKSRELVEA